LSCKRWHRRAKCTANAGIVEIAGIFGSAGYPATFAAGCHAFGRVPRLGYSLAVVGAVVERGLIFESPPRLASTQAVAPGNAATHFGFAYWTVTVPAVPPRTLNAPTTFILRGDSSATRSSQIVFVTASKKIPLFRYAW
jgi:hypothetical protein